MVFGLKDGLQLVVSALAPGVTLGLAAMHDRERISGFIAFGQGVGQGASFDASFVGIHNRSTKAIAITSIRWRDGIVRSRVIPGTALDYEHPEDLRFPYLIEPGAIHRFALDEHALKRLALRRRPAPVLWLANLLRLSRIRLDCRTTTGRCCRVAAERALPWSDRLPWAQV